MFYRSDIQVRKKRRKTAGKAAERKRKPYNLRARRPHGISEFDMKQINLLGKTLYALCAIDQYTRRPVVPVSSSCLSAAGKTALQKIKQQFTKDIIINDNGSENMGKAEQWLKEEQITQYRCRPNKPKDSRLLSDLSERYRLNVWIIITNRWMCTSCSKSLTS